MRSEGSLDRAAREREHRARITARCRRLVAEADGDTLVHPLRDQDLREPDGGEAAGPVPERAALSIAEMFLPHSPDEWRSTDLLAVLSAVYTPDAEGGPPTTLTYFVGPEDFRRSAAAVASGTLVSDLWVAWLPRSWERTLELSLLLYRLRRTRQTQRVVETLQVLKTAIDYGRDLQGSQAVGDTLLDRVQVLAHARDAEPVLAAAYTLGRAATPAGGSRYLLFLKRRETPFRELTPFVWSGRLLGGADLETATPFRLQEFVLLRLGGRVERRGPTRSIQQLRRERALSAATPRVDETERESQRDVVEREARLREARRLTRIYGAEGMQRLPVVTPLALEVAHDLIPLVEAEGSTLHHAFQELVNLMRSGLRYELGLEVPGIRVRGNTDDLPVGSYLILLDEVPLVMGTVDEERTLCNATVDELRLIGIEATPAVNPANGAVCAWIATGDRERVRREGTAIRADGVQLWSATEYMILHLSAVVRKNAADFVGVRAAAELIRAVGQDLYERIRVAHGGLPAFTELLRTLLEEEVPIKAMDALCRSYLEMVAVGVPFYRIVEEVRCLDEIRPALRRGRESVHAYTLGPEFAATLERGILHCGGAAILALEPEPTQEMLRAVRTEIETLPPDAPNPVLLVEDWPLRRPARKLVELEFPHLSVLARRDLADLDPAAVTELAVIELELDDHPSRRGAGR